MGVVDLAEADGDVVVRARGSDALLSARVRGVVDNAHVPAPPGPLVTLHAGVAVPTHASQSDRQPWFEEKTRVPKGELARMFFFSVFALGCVIQLVLHGSLGWSDVLLALWIVGMLSLAPAVWFASRRTTTIDQRGVTQSRVRHTQLFPFERMTTVQRYSVEKASGPTRVVLTLDDDSTVTVVTPRPDEFLAALRRGRDFV